MDPWDFVSDYANKILQRSSIEKIDQAKYDDAKQLLLIIMKAFKPSISNPDPRFLEIFHRCKTQYEFLEKLEQEAEAKKARFEKEEEENFLKRMDLDIEMTDLSGRKKGGRKKRANKFGGKRATADKSIQCGIDSFDLLNLPEEILLAILSTLDAASLCSLSLTCNHLCHLVSKEEVWIALGKRLHGVDMAVSSTFSPRQFYKAWLHKLGPFLGLWQRIDLRYYSSLVRVAFKEQIIVVDLISAQQLDQPLRVTPLLKAVCCKDR